MRLDSIWDYPKRRSRSRSESSEFNAHILSVGYFCTYKYPICGLMREYQSLAAIMIVTIYIFYTKEFLLISNITLLDVVS
jgi:hypothetical protein